MSNDLKPVCKGCGIYTAPGVTICLDCVLGELIP